MARNPPPELRELAKQRLQRLREPSPEELEKEIEEARLQGYKVIALPGLRIWIEDYSVKPPEKE
jgi:hypothetical protein